MADQFTEDRTLEDACRDGEKRLANQQKMSAALLLPAAKFPGDGSEIFASHAKYLSPAEVNAYHLELYRRVQGFLDFFDDNVGGTSDFPLILSGESEEALDMFVEKLSEMRAAVGLLTEL